MEKPQLTKRNEIFNQQAVSNIVYGRYDLSSRCTGSFRMGVLYPIFCRNDITPGDKFQISSAPFIRFLPLVSPSLTNVDVEVRYFFVPRRILWSQWKNWLSPSNSDDLALVEPYIPNFETIESKDFYFNVAGSIFDYMGCSSIPWAKSYSSGGNPWTYGIKYVAARNGGVSNSAADLYDFIDKYAPCKYIAIPGSVNHYPLKYSAYPFLAYNAIYNEYFRDENLDAEELQHVTTGGGHHAYKFLLKRVNWEKDYFAGALPWVTQSVFTTPTISSGDTIEQLREASALTKWLEMQAVGGHRYQESILSHFGIRVPDEAAQIPVYLGGGKCPVQIGSVEQTTPEDDKLTPLATLGGKAVAAESMFVDKFEFKEHGTILGLMYIRPKALYADVTPRDMFAKSSRHDMLWPEFVNLGDEAVKTNELNPGWWDWGNTDFGYQMRYASYRTSFDQVHGQLRPEETLESWTQSRSWSEAHSASTTALLSPVYLSGQFIKCNPSDRIFAVNRDDDNMVGEVTTFVDAERPCPSYVDPKID